MKADVELMIQIGARAIEEQNKVYVEIRGDQEHRGPITALEKASTGGASLVRIVWATGQTYCRPDDLVAVTVNNK